MFNPLDDFLCEVTQEEKETDWDYILEDTNRCVVCGECIPEGRQVCKKCEEEAYNEYV